MIDFTPNKAKMLPNGRKVPVLNQLFFETNSYYPGHEDMIQYTLKREEHKGYPSLYQLYMQEADPTEYTFAVKYMYDWSHWKRLTEAKWFQEYITLWREELACLLQSEALAAIIKEAADPKSKSAYQANKFLLAKGWMDKPTPVTRTAKEKIRRAAEDLSNEDKLIAEDAQRLLEGKAKYVN